MSHDFINIEKPGTAKSRGRVYRLLSALYLEEVTPELLTTLKIKEVEDILENLGVVMGHVFLDVPHEELLNDLAEEYAAMFIVSGGIPPYESVRLKGLLCQEPAWEVEEFYKRCGLVIKEDCRSFPDHIGMELDFMGYLADKESAAWEANDRETAIKHLKLQKEFFSNHISNWAYGFLDDLEKYAFHPFYREVVKLTRSFLDTEKDYMEG